MEAYNGGDRTAGAVDPAAEEAGTKSKSRNVKTPLQKEVLEASYQLNPNPNQQFRRTLAERIGLTEEQVNSWFSTRRRKDKPKDGPPAAVPTAAAAAPLASPSAAAAAVPSTDASGLAAGYASGYDSEAAGGGGSMGAPAALPPASAAVSGGTAWRSSDPAPGSMDAITAELLEAAKASLPVSFREDGPPLSFVFDSVPAPNSKKGMQAAALIAAKRKKMMGMEGTTVSAAMAAMPQAVAPPAPAAVAAAGEGDIVDQGPAKRPKLGPEGPAPVVDVAQVAHQEAMQQLAALHATSTQAPSGREIMKAERERQREEARKAKELEKARAAQERENKKREAQLERERKAEEKRKAAEDKRREKEMAKALLQQERASGRKSRGAGEGTTVHHHHHGPPDDLDLEMEALLVRARATAAAQAAARGLDPSAVEPVVPPRPEFPPPYLMMQPAFPPELDGDLGPQLIEAWGFVTGFCDLLGVPVFSMESLLTALLQGSSSPLLGLVHIILLRQAQADMEEAHATGVLQSPQPHLMDKALVTAAQRLEEAWAWGLDPDLWRAHLGPLTWPEVLRQTALAGGAGGSRVFIKHQVQDGALDVTDGTTGAGGKRGKKWRAPKGSIGFEGEDVASGWAGDGPLKLQLPARFGEGTWMSAAWRVLAAAGPEGLPVPEVVRQIAIHGYRDMGTSKNPEASVTGALSRDILFMRLNRGTYALQSIVTYYQRMQAAGKTPVVEPPQNPTAAGGTGGGPTAMAVDGQDSDSEEEEEEDEEEVVARAPEDPSDAEPWTITLKHQGYDALSLADRVMALLWLIGVIVDGPGVRMRLEAREREVAALRKQLQDDMKADKKRRQEEAAMRARAAAEQAQQRLEELQRAAAAGEVITPDAMAAAEAAAKALTAAAGGLPGHVAASRAATPIPIAAAPATTPSSATGQQQQQQEGPSPMQEDEHQQHQQPVPVTLQPGDDTTPKQQQQQQSEHDQMQQQQQASSASPTQPATDPRSSTPQPQQQQLTEQQQDEAKQKQQQEAAQRAELEAELAAESARRAARAEAIRRCEELNVLRLEPLGMDRRFNKYWLLVAPDYSVTSSYWGRVTAEGQQEGSGSKDQGHPADGNTARIFVEYGDGSKWKVILRPQQLDQLKQVLEPRGLREGALHQSLLRVEAQVRAAMPGAHFTMPKSLDQQPPEIQQEATAASNLWLQRGHVLIAATLTSSRQEDDISAALAAAQDLSPDQQQQQQQQQQQGNWNHDVKVKQLKRDMLRVEALLADQMQVTCTWDHQSWVQSVAAAQNLTSLRNCLADLEAALEHEGQGEDHKGKKTRGRQKAEAERVPLISHSWKIMQNTPCVKGAWLACGAEVATAQLDLQGWLAPVLPALPSAAAALDQGEGGTPAPETAAAATTVAAAAEPGKLDPRHEEMLHRQQQHRQGLKWLPATVHALSWRLAALDAVLQYPALGDDRAKLYGRQVISAYRYITKPAPIYPPATLDQLLAQEKAAAVKALPPTGEQQQQQRSASCPPEDSKQQQPDIKDEQQQPAVKEEQETPQQAQQENQQQQQQFDLPVLQDVLCSRLRCAYGYSLAGRGLLQLIRGLPPYPDWTQQARLDEFSIPVSAYQAAVKAATDDGTINMTLQEIQQAKEAEAARLKAEQEAKAAARAAEKAAKEAAAAAADAGGAAAGPAKTLPPKGKVKIKLGGQAGAAAAKSSKQAAASGAEKGEKHDKQSAGAGSSNGAASVAPKLRIKGKGITPKSGDSSREPSRENSPAPAATAAEKGSVGHHQGPKASVSHKKLGSAVGGGKAAAAAGGKGGGKLTGRLKLRHTGKAAQQQEEEVDAELLDDFEDDD